ncbi:hypothetical protein ACUAXN_001627 [Escherichia coli]|nr:hypothetical protein [Escherichia coli]EJG3158111.1 hypothetical protein [Escherichia coli]EKR5255260.1 hypothetical protein [Escherichia coli]
MGVSQGFESYNYIVNQWFAWHDSFLLSHHLNQVVTPYSNTPRFLLCRIYAIVTLAINQNTVLTSGNAGADI